MFFVFGYKSRSSERSLPRTSPPFADFIFECIAFISALTSFAICAASLDLERFIYIKDKQKKYRGEKEKERKREFKRKRKKNKQ